MAHEARKKSQAQHNSGTFVVGEAQNALELLFLDRSLQDASFSVFRIEILVVFIPQRVTLDELRLRISRNIRQKPIRLQVFPLVKQEVSRVEVDVVHAHFAATRVVETIPFLTPAVLSVRYVMTSAQNAVVTRNAVEVVRRFSVFTSGL